MAKKGLPPGLAAYMRSKGSSSLKPRTPLAEGVKPKPAKVPAKKPSKQVAKLATKPAKVPAKKKGK